MKDLFLKLVKIPSPSGHEQVVAKFLVNYLDKLGWKAQKDKWGNVVATLTAPGKRVLLASHMDTVQKPGQLIKPMFRAGKFTSDGTTILGADNKAGIIVLLEVARELINNPIGVEVVLVFTIREEAGEMGSSLLDLADINPDYIVNVDGGKTPGTIDVRALGQTVFEIKVLGKAAHAAINPEKGIHAIKVASEIVTHLEMGKTSQGEVVNIGQVSGGIQTNVIPDEVMLKGEVRAFDQAKINLLFTKVKNMAKAIALKYGAQTHIQMISKIGVPVWEEKDGQELVEFAKAAAKKLGLKFIKSEMWGSSDANYLSQHGVPTISVNRGGKNPHSASESISLREMVETKSFLSAILSEIANNGK